MHLYELGFEVTGVEPSVDGSRIASTTPLDLREGSTEDDLVETFGQFPIVLSLEVIEHVYSPARFAKCVTELLVPGGIAIISTPYHSYLKNLALAASGKMDSHFTALWEGGHIKFFSRSTQRELFNRVGLREVDFLRSGRIPIFAKSMVAVFRKPAQGQIDSISAK